MLRDTNDLVEESVLLVFDDPSVVCEGADAHSLCFRAAPFEEEIAVGTNQRYYSRRRVRSEGRIFADLEGIGTY
jgi:hypothetical protein